MDRSGNIPESRRELNCFRSPPGAEDTEVVTVAGREHASSHEGMEGAGVTICDAEVRGKRSEVGRWPLRAGLSWDLGERREGA